MIAKAAIFDPWHYEAVRCPLFDAETMPAWCYTLGPFYRRELERIFHKAWNFLGAADRLRVPGDYFTIEEDIIAFERQQRGLDSSFARPRRFPYREPLVHTIDNWILDRVFGG
jgi:hypothetical protein